MAHGYLPWVNCGCITTIKSAPRPFVNQYFVLSVLRMMHVHVHLSQTSEQPDADELD